MFSTSAEFYDLIYSTFKDYVAEVEQITSLLRRLNPQCQTILDVACGTGEHARLLAAKGFVVDGLDLDPAFVRIAAQKHWFELLETGKIDWKETPPGLGLDDMIRTYEKAHAELAPARERVDERRWNEKLTQFVMDGRVLFEIPLGEMFWPGLFDAIHHRGQLSVYIRPMGGRVPSIYGPCADDPGN